FHNSLPTIARSEVFRQFWVPNPGIMTEINEANLGSVNCHGYGYNDIPESAVGFNEPGYLGEQYLRGEGTVKLTAWAPNRLEYDVATPAPNVLVINQNYFPGWRLISQEGKLEADARLITVELPAGQTHVILGYRTQRLFTAFALTMV